MTLETGKKRGRLVTVEGIEGVGKSTNIEFIAEHLRSAGRSIVITREPGGVPVAERIREILLSADTGHIPPMSELLLMFAARFAHLEELIRPALGAGRWVVCDRFTDASYAYQGAGRGLPTSTVSTLETLVQGSLRPDLTLLLDASWEETEGRRRQRGEHDRFEVQGQAFFDRVRHAYLEMAQREPQRLRIIDASQPVDDVRKQIATVLDDFIAGSF